VTLVVDASVACKWFITEVQAAEAEALLAADAPLLAPDLIISEVCNVAWLKSRRGEITTEQAAAMVDHLPDLLDEVASSTPLASRALAIAIEVGHPAYDCFYLALAEQRRTQVVTADRRLISRLAGTKWASLLLPLGGEAA
jgi:predicted nucleic acid-binding protein